MQTRTALKRLSNGQVDYSDRMTSGGPLAENASWLMERHAQKQQEVESARQRHEYAQSLPVLEVARKKLAEMVGNNVLPDDTPIATRFDVFDVVKKASKDNPKDLGLKSFAIHLERLWHKEPLGTITAGALSRLRDHYQTQNPRSVVGEVTDKYVPKVAFNNLPVAQLTRIAAEIESQEDYDIAIVRHGLHRDDIRSVRARAFIRELVDRKMNAEQQLQDDNAAVGTAKRSRAGDIGNRVANRILKEGQVSDTQSVDDYDNYEEDGGSKSEQAGMGTAGTGMLSTVAKREWYNMLDYLAQTGEGIPRVASKKEAVAPPGWEKTVKEMKNEPEIDNPYALAWWMKGKGYKPSGSDKGSQTMPNDVPPGTSRLPGKDDVPQIQSDKESQSVPTMPGKTTVGSKTAADKEQCFDPEVNDQQDDQISVPDDGGAALKGKSKKATVLGDFAVKADHPLVDDNQDHFPSFTLKQSESLLKTAYDMKKSPSWWLGSVDELLSEINSAYVSKDAELNKDAGDLPPEFEENIKKKKDTNQSSEKKEGRFDPSEIEACLLDGNTYEVGKYALHIDTNNGSEQVVLRSKQGSRKYALSEIDGAIADFMLVAKDEKIITAPDPVFVVREGFRITCPACSATNSYPMPKEASDVGCANCDALLPAQAIKSAFNIGAASEEATLITFIPISMQESFGDKFAKAAEMIGADDIGASGPRAEAYVPNPDSEKMAQAWDFLLESGFKPLAQYYGFDGLPESGPELGGEEMPPLDMTEAPIPEMGDEGVDVPDLGEPTGGAEWADNQMAQAAMMHYKAQGNSVIEAVTQFTKDYGEGYDPEMVMQVAAQVYGIGLDQVKIGMMKGAAGDIPSTNVNQQQSDYVNVGNPSSTMTPEGDLQAPSVNQQTKMQSQPGTSSGDTGMSHGDDVSKTVPTPGKPKAEHPPTKQQGVSLSPTEGPGAGLGPGEHSDNPPSKDLDKSFTQGFGG